MELHPFIAEPRQGSTARITLKAAWGAEHANYTSTLLHLLGALDRPDSGTVEIGGESLAGLSGARLAAFRNRTIGFVFQFHHLLPDFTALENVMLPGRIAGLDPRGVLENARRLGVVMKELLAELGRKHPSVGAARSIGLFGLVELVRDKAKKVPLAPFNGTSDEMAALGKFFREEGLYTFVRWNTFFTNPPLCISEAQLRDAFAIIDRGLEITDKAVK